MSFIVVLVCHTTLPPRRYEEAKAKGLVNYDRELESVLDKLVVECDRKIVRSFKRLEDDEGASALDSVKVSEVIEVGAFTGRGVALSPHDASVFFPSFAWLSESVAYFFSNVQSPESTELTKKIDAKMREIDQLGKPCCRVLVFSVGPKALRLVHRDCGT